MPVTDVMMDNYKLSGVPSGITNSAQRGLGCSQFPSPRDVASFDGHVGIYIGNGLTISATEYDGVVRNDWGFRHGQARVFRRFVGY